MTNQHSRSDGGFTLIEIAVAMAILAILGTVLAATVTTGSRFTTATATRARSEFQNLDLLDRTILRDIPATKSIGTASADTVSLLVNGHAGVTMTDTSDGQVTVTDTPAPDCRQVIYAWTGSQVTSTTTGCGTAATPGQPVVIATGVTGFAVTYYGADGQPLPTPVATGTPVARIGLTTTIGGLTLSGSATPRTRGTPVTVTG